MNSEYLMWGLAVLVAYQLFVTIRLLISARYSRSQKTAQFLLIWLVPFLGAVACEIFLSSDNRTPDARDTSFTPDGGDNPPGTGMHGL
jgi:hypothetical protein